MTKIKDTDFVTLREFGDAMRPIRLQGLQAMGKAKARLVANGVSPEDASDMLNAVLKQLGKEVYEEERK